MLLTQFAVNRLAVGRYLGAIATATYFKLFKFGNAHQSLFLNVLPKSVTLSLTPSLLGEGVPVLLLRAGRENESDKVNTDGLVAESGSFKGCPIWKDLEYLIHAG